MPSRAPRRKRRRRNIALRRTRAVATDLLPMEGHTMADQRMVEVLLLVGCILDMARKNIRSTEAIAGVEAVGLMIRARVVVAVIVMMIRGGDIRRVAHGREYRVEETRWMKFWMESVSGTWM